MSGSLAYRMELRRRQARDARPVEPAPHAPTPVREQIPDDLPRIKASGTNCYQVLRAVYPKGHPAEWHWELIAETSTELEAIMIQGAQKYKAVVSHRFKKGNWRPSCQPMKELA